MSLLLAWLVFPLVLLVLAIGCGLLVERLGGAAIDGALLAPIGFAAVIVIAGLFTTTSAPAPFAARACVAAAIAGLVAGRTRLGRPCGWAAVAALGVFLAYAAPVLFSGKATFAGYIKLDDTATWAAMTDRLMTNGRSIGGLAPSTYQATLNFSLGQGYPVGSLLPWGVGRVLVGQDLLWVVQPYLAFCAAMLALTIWWLVRGLIRLPWAAAGAAFVAAQPALLFGYSLWGGVKELSGAACIAVAAAVVPTAVASPSRARRVLPLAVAAAATLSVFSLGAVIWLAAALAGGLALLAASRPPLRAAG